MRLKLTCFFLASLLLFSCNIFSQIAYYDARSLEFDTVDNKIVIKSTPANYAILANYVRKKTPTPADITQAFQDNPFFTVAGAEMEATTIFPLRHVFSHIGGLNVTNFADGLAKFLVKRFKEELSITFFEKFKDDLTKNYEELRVLFPQTSRTLLVIDKEIYNFSKYLNSLREAFIKDLGNLYTGLKKVKDLPRYQVFFTNHPEINTIVINAFYFIDQYKDGVHPGEVIENYDEDTFLNFSDLNLQTNLRSSVKVLKVFSGSLKSISTVQYWVSADSVKRMLANSVLRDIYFGLIYQKCEGISFQAKTGPFSFQELLRAAKTTETILKDCLRFIDKIIDNAQEVDEYIELIRDKKKNEIDFNDYYKLYNAGLNILNEGLMIVHLPGLNIESSMLDNITSKVISWIGISRTAGELYIDIRTKNYSSAILNAVSIFDATFGNSFDNKLRENILRYGTFIATVAAAESPDEVKEAIEAIALPVGSSRVKRESLKNISLNAYVGGFGGGEYLPALKENPTSFAFGLTAPVGIAFSFGNIPKKRAEKKGGKSVSFFLSAIDVGALASFRLNDDSSKVAAEIQLKNIIAPGLFIYYGFGKCPISIGAGVQMGPQLRQVTAKDINIDKNYYLRYGITLAVDIPLLNFYTKSN